jgi:hypothetical protein
VATRALSVLLISSAFRVFRLAQRPPRRVAAQSKN